MKKGMLRRTDSLKHRQLHTFIISFVLPTAVLIFFLFGFFLHQSSRFSRREHENTLEVLSSHLTNAINSDLQMSLAYIYNNDISYFYNFLSRTEMEDDLVTYNQLLTPYTKAVSRSITLQNDNILGFGFLPCKHNLGKYFYLLKYKNMDVRDFDLHTAPWYDFLSENDTGLVFLPNEELSGSHAISIIRAAKNVDMKLTIGYIVVDVSMDFLYNLLDSLSISPHSGILLFSPTGDCLFSTNPELADSTFSELSGKTSGKLHGALYEIQELTTETGGFSIYYLSSRKDQYADFLVAFLLVLAVYFGLFVAAVLLFRYNSRKITASVTPILETMARYNGGDAASRCEPDNLEILEFQKIADNLNYMIEKINLHIQNEYKLKIEQKTAEYQALQAEVDPHFLYNMLNLFISLNRIGAKTELEQAIVSLSHLFRYTCEHTSDSTIGREFSFIRDYLFLQKIRFDERLEFNLFLDPELENFRIPKLLVQPLVENAIVHSLEPSGENILIQLSAVTTRNKNGFQFTIISVTNTGLPYRADQVPPGRTGLENIQNRLRLFNPNAIFYIGGGPGKPTKCYIIIPTELT